MRLRPAPLLFILFLALIASPARSSAQDEAATIDVSRIPAEARDVNGFVPPGWKIEEKIAGDLNGDAVPDYALKLVEDKPAKTAEEMPNERGRALVVVLAGKDGRLARAGVADKLLQCTSCGGAFYGVVEAPASVSIARGVLVINQDHGSRDVTETTYRFRYEPDTGRFALIGFDLSDHDRLTGMNVTESTNYLTGLRVVTRGNGEKDRTSRTQVRREKIYLEQVDGGKFEGDAYERLHLN
jgi:hypothetical protein